MNFIDWSFDPRVYARPTFNFKWWKKKKKKRAYRQTHTANGIDAASAGDAHDDIDRLLYAQFFFPQQIYTPICEQVKAPKM